MKRSLQAFTLLFLFLVPSLAYSQGDPIAALLARYQLARTPFDAEGLVVPGSLIVGGDGIATELVLPYEISTTDVDFADAALKDMTVVPLESVDGGSSSAGGGGLTIQKWAPGMTVKSAAGLTSDQALFTVAEISSTAINKLVLHQNDIEGIWKDWNRDVPRNVWLVQAVFYTKELNVADSTARQITLATGGKLPDCPTTLSVSALALDASSKTGTDPTKTAPQAPTTTPSAEAGKPATPSNASASATTPTNGITGTVDGFNVSLGVAKPSDSKNSTASNIQKNVAAATTVATTAADIATGLANGTLVTAYGYSCRDAHDVAHLVSTTPVAIGLKVVPVGHFVHVIHIGKIPTGVKSKATDFTWDVAPATPPVFTNAKDK